MNDDELQKLLHQADASLPHAALRPTELSQRVRERARHDSRRAKTIVGGSSLSMVLLAIVAWRSIPPSHVESAAPDLSAEMSEIAQLTAEADQHLRIARRIMELEKADRAAAALREERAAPDPDDELRYQIDLVAYRMIIRADRMRVDMQPAEEIVAIYQQVTQSFPDSTYADLARQRLMELGSI